MLIRCCVCHRYREGERWVNEQPPRRKREFISHSYCPTCAQQALTEMRRNRGPRPGSVRRTIV